MELYWELFYETGDPVAYVLYRGGLAGDPPENA